MADFSRARRVAEEIQKVLSSALLVEVADERLRGVTIAEVKLSPDLRSARVFWLPLTDEDREPRRQRQLQRALDSATPFLRGHLGRAMVLRFVPELRFYLDDATERGRAMDSLLESLRDEEPPGDPQGDAE